MRTLHIRGSSPPPQVQNTLKTASPPPPSDPLDFRFHVLHINIYFYPPLRQVLLDDYDEADAACTIAEDWEGDAKGDDVLTNGEFGDALFE